MRRSPAGWTPARTVCGAAVVATTIVLGLPGAAAEPAARPANPADDVPAARTIEATAAALRPATVDWSPDRPAQGTVFTIRVSPSDAAIERVTGELAGEPLHFHDTADGVRTALAAVPIDASGEVVLRLTIRQSDGRVDERAIAVPVSAGDYRMERLTVAPEYGGGYDAQTAARIQRESARAREVSSRSHETPRLWEPPFVRPRPSRITSGFGNGREFNGEIQSRHMGTDFAGDVGSPVHAAADGVVRLVDGFYLGGNVVYIDHGAGLVTAYLHLSEQTVEAGDTVAAGDVVGRVGATGRVTGPHLHWIVRYGGITVDGLSLPGVEP